MKVYNPLTGKEVKGSNVAKVASTSVDQLAKGAVGFTAWLHQTSTAIYAASKQE